jgi:hypothetical protein
MIRKAERVNASSARIEALAQPGNPKAALLTTTSVDM